jgi:hypothetical protein
MYQPLQATDRVAKVPYNHIAIFCYMGGVKTTFQQHC